MLDKSTSFSIGDHFDDFVNAQVGQGRYDSASDVVRAGLRLLEEKETTLAALRAALIEGEKSGPSTRFDLEAFIARKRQGTSPIARAAGPFSRLSLMMRRTLECPIRSGSAFGAIQDAQRPTQRAANFWTLYCR